MAIAGQTITNPLTREHITFVKTARDTAWTNAELLWELQNLPSLSDDFMMVLDRMTGLAGRGLLTIV